MLLLVEGRTTKNQHNVEDAYHIDMIKDIIMNTNLPNLPFSFECYSSINRADDESGS
mgnify:FL=1